MTPGTRHGDAFHRRPGGRIEMKETERRRAAVQFFLQNRGEFNRTVHPLSIGTGGERLNQRPAALTTVA